MTVSRPQGARGALVGGRPQGVPRPTTGGVLLSATVFGYTGGDQTLTVSGGADWCVAYLWSAAGGGPYQPRPERGGCGVYVPLVFRVVDGDLLLVRVGGGGLSNYSVYSDLGAGGGGRTELLRNASIVAILGAGGGCTNGNGGPGGASVGGDGEAGTGGTQYGGGVSTVTPATAAGYRQGASLTGGKAGGWPNGGNGSNGGGQAGRSGGGDGFFGGGAAGMAGGGSSLAANVQTVPPGSAVAPGATNPYYRPGIALGALCTDQKGGDGLAVIELWRGPPTLKG